MKSKVTKKPAPCWNPLACPDQCDRCLWLSIHRKVGKRFLMCPRPEAKKMRVAIVEMQIADETRRHKTAMEGLNQQLRRYVAELNGKGTK